MRKKLLTSMVVLLILIIALPATAQEYPEPTNDIKTFGFTDNRHRHAYIYGMGFQGLMQHQKGPSYSQPLILNSDNTWGGKLQDRRVAVTIENNTVYGLLLPSTMEPPPAYPAQLEELWSIPLHGSKPTKSDATYFEADNGKKYLFIGTYSDYIDVIDITDFENAFFSDEIECNYASDITSAPLILKWNGHNILIAATGDTGNVVIIADPLQPDSQEFYIDVGAGRTSSSPTPVDNGKGFAVGLDGAQGFMKVYYLDEILEEGPGGIVQQRSGTAHYQKTLPTGLPASFSSHGNNLYFGDKESRIYLFNTETGNYACIDSHSAVGTFSNRSPALDLTNNLIVFPAVGRTGNGAVVAVNYKTGNTEWVQNFSGRAQTSPVVVTDSSGTQIWEGTSDGWFVKINPENGNRISAEPFAEKLHLEEYSYGVSGQISAVGPFMLAATESGVKGYWLTDYLNYQAINIDPGIPKGEKAQPGKTYHGTATFKYETGIYPWITSLVGVYYGDQYLKVYYENGDELLKSENLPNGGTAYNLGMELGKEVTVHFDWTAGTSDTLTSLINLNQHPVVQYRDETTLQDNEVSVNIPINIQNLIVKILKYPDKAKPGDPVSVGARIINESGEMLVTRLIAKVNGSVVKDIDNFDIIQQHDAAVEFNMPDGDSTVEFIVNPDKDKPANESTWQDNSASRTIAKVTPPWDKSGGRLKVNISAPARVEPFKDWGFNVSISGYLPPPPPDSDQRDYANVSLKVTGHSENMEYRYSNGTWGDIIITNKWPVDLNKTITVTVPRGEEFTKTRHFTFTPSSGYPGRDYSIPLHAEAIWKAPWDEIYKGEDAENVLIFREKMDPSVNLTE